MKDTFYFSHDYNARSDDKVKLLIRKHGFLGYGIYWAIVEDLYNNANALRTDYEGIAYDMRVDVNVVKSIINDFKLFVIEGEEFGSMSVQRRLDDREHKSKKARDSANKRWGNNANALPTHSERNAKKERKGKESKDINIPIWEEFREYAMQHKANVNIEVLHNKYKGWVQDGWKDGYGKPIKNWKTKILNTLPHLKEASTRPADEYAAHMQSILRP